MKRVLKQIWAAIVAAQARRAQAQVLAHLDARTLKDIGLESWNPDLARRIDSMRRQDALVWRSDLGYAGLR
ncbi:MAG TPA: DUF1127 domain-containing protein [Burkholderiales bacterium]|nr:DUF1127 domain-containing protein [Burkholderiales bacterium]